MASSLDFFKQVSRKSTPKRFHLKGLEKPSRNREPLPSLGVLDILIGKVAVALIGKIVSKKLFRCSNCSEYFEQRDVLVIKLIMFLLALIFFIVPIAISVSYYLIHEYIKI